MKKKSLALALASLFVASVSSAAVLDGDDVMVSSSAGKFKDWSLTFFSIASVKNMNPTKEAKGNRSVESYDYLSMNYKADANTRFSLRLPFNFNTAGYNAYGDEKTSDVALQDIHFVYSNYDLGYVGDIDLSGKAKVYLPTGQASANAKTITKIRFEGYADYAITRKLSVAYIVKPDIYWQTQTAAINTSIPVNEDGFRPASALKTTQQFGLEHYVQFQYDINSMFSLATKSGFDEGWYHASAAENLEASHNTALRLGLDLWIRPMRGLSFTLGVSNQTYLNSGYQGKDVAIGEPQNTQYSLMTNALLF